MAAYTAELPGLPARWATWSSMRTGRGATREGGAAWGVCPPADAEIRQPIQAAPQAASAAGRHLAPADSRVACPLSPDDLRTCLDRPPLAGGYGRIPPLAGAAVPAGRVGGERGLSWLRTRDLRGRTFPAPGAG